MLPLSSELRPKMAVKFAYSDNVAYIRQCKKALDYLVFYICCIDIFLNKCTCMYVKMVCYAWGDRIYLDIMIIIYIIIYITHFEKKTVERISMIHKNRRSSETIKYKGQMNIRIRNIKVR